MDLKIGFGAPRTFLMPYTKRMPFQLELSDKEVTTDMMGALFKASVLMAEYSMSVRNRATGTTVDVGGGRSGVVSSVDSNHMHVRASDGSKHQVPLTLKRLTQLSAEVRKPRRSPKTK